jgi:hypothetical protein
MKPSEIIEEEELPSLDELPYETICTAIRCHLDMLESASPVKDDNFNEVQYVATFTKKEQARIKSSMLLWFNFLELMPLK